MSVVDREHWDERYAAGGLAPVLDEPPLSPFLAPIAHLMPMTGHALELACGRGRGAVWLAKRGMDYRGVDVSPVAVELARELALRSGVGDRCRFDVFDLDNGLPPGPPVDLLLCHLFVDRRLDHAMMDRLAPGGILVVVSLSEVGHGPGDFRIRPGELLDAFDSLEVLDHTESEGVARIVAHQPASTPDHTVGGIPDQTASALDRHIWLGPDKSTARVSSDAPRRIEPGDRS
jgi:SAM-dependent methyltransferase